MMIMRVRGATRVLGKSQGYIGLPVRDEYANLGELPHCLHVLHNNYDGSKTPCMVTAWQPTPDELKRLNDGAPLYLKIIGVAHPPVQIEVGEPSEVIRD